MLPILCAQFLVAMSSIFVSNVYSQSENCGYVSEVLQNNNSDGAWPWMVAVTMKNVIGKYNLRCNGFLIDRRHVLTPAHCYDLIYKLDEFTARIGKKNWKVAEEYKVTCITIHPRYDPDYVYDDIAILTLSRDVDYTPICLPEDNLRTKRLDGLTVTWTVWSKDERRMVSRNLKQFSGLRILSNKYCNKVLLQQLENPEFPGLVSGDMLCTTIPSIRDRNEVSLRFGGAPLMYKDKGNKWIAVGLSVVRLSRGTETTYVHIKVSDYLEWIMENTRNGKEGCS